MPYTSVVAFNGDRTMLVFIAIVLGQFPPVPNSMTVEKFIEQSNSTKLTRINTLVDALNKRIQPTATGGRQAEVKQVVSVVLRRIQELEELRDPSKFFPLEVDLSKPVIGAVGVPIHDDAFADEVGLPAKITQVIDKGTMLATIGGSLFCINGISTLNFADTSDFTLEGIWSVSGKYSYTDTRNAKATVFSVSPWKYNSEYQRWLNDQISKGKKPASSDSVSIATPEQFCMLSWERRQRDIRFLNEKIVKLAMENDFNKLGASARKTMEKPFRDQIALLVANRDLDWNIRDPQATERSEVFKIQRTNARLAINDQYRVEQVIDDNTVLAVYSERRRVGGRTSAVEHRLVIGGMKPTEFLEKTGAPLKLSGTWYRDDDVKLGGQTHRRIVRWPHEEAVKRRWAKFLKDQEQALKEATDASEDKKK
jgi:hypothetical protein